MQNINVLFVEEVEYIVIADLVIVHSWKLSIEVGRKDVLDTGYMLKNMISFSN